MLITLAIALPAGDAPPSEFRLFRQGKNDTEKGVFTFDAKAAKVVMSRYEKRGTRCFFDYNHASLEKAPVDPKASAKSAGWFDLEVRDGELWATNINWTPPALEAFANKEFAYFSPAFSTDGDGRVTDLINCALTNLPATHDIPQLVAADRRTELSVAFSTIHCAVEKALSEIYEDDDEGEGPNKCPWVRELFDDSVVFEWDGELLRQGYSYDEKSDTAELTGEAQEVRVEYVPVATPTAQLGRTVETGGPGTETSINTNSRAPEAHGTTSALSGNGETTMDDDTKKTIEDLKAQVAKYKKMAEDGDEELKRMKKLAAEPKKVVDEDNDEMKKASRIVAAARQATGKTEADDVAGALVVLSTALETNKTLVGRLEALESVALAKRVDEAIAAGKLLPSKRDVMLANGAKALDTYLEMIGETRVGPPTGEHQPDPDKKAPAVKAETPVQLNASERAQMEAFGISEERMVALKRETVGGKVGGATFTLPGFNDAQPLIK